MVRSLSTNHVLPDNPAWIEIERSDGNSHRWPSNIDMIVDEAGHVNYMRPCDLDESISVHWRRLIGNELAKRLNHPAGKDYYLKAWPAGYQFYDHNKGPKANPRHDAYLIGSELIGKFRSPAEFIPHALWLITDATANRANCGCKYCSKTPQRTVSDVLGLPQTRPRSSPNMSSSQTPRATKESTRTYAAVRRAPKPLKLPKGPTQFTSPERERDLMAAISSKGMASKRWAREGELVWCALNQPISWDYEQSEEDSIMFWPGLVEEIRLKTVVIPLSGSKIASGEDVEMEDAATGSGLNGFSSPHSKRHGEDDNEVPWKVTQSTVYKVKLLAVLSYYLTPDDKLLPYQAYAPSNNVLSAIKSVDVNLNELGAGATDEEVEPRLISRFSTFQPILHERSAALTTREDSDKRFREAAGPFGLAIQIASRLAGFWTPTDEWQFKVSLSAQASSYPTAPSQNQVSSLSAALDGSSASQTASTIPRSVSSSALQNTAGSSQTPLALPVQSFNTRTAANREKQDIMTQTRFQGLWWGAERIWTDELVRLKLGRHQFAPEGAEMIKIPAGPSEKTLRFYAEQELPDGDPGDRAKGAAGRGLFMKIQGIFLVDVPSPNGSVPSKECRACGMLYELVEEDWVDPEESKDVSGASIENATVPAPSLVDVKGKGKAKEYLHGLEHTRLSLIPLPPETIAPAMLMNTTPSAAAIQQEGPAGTLELSHPSTPPLHTNPAVTTHNPFGGASTPTQPLHTQSRPVGAQPAQEPKSEQGPLSRGIAYSPYPLPPAPKGYKFRAILPRGYEAVVGLTLLSGRYYPSILAHPLLRPTIVAALASTAHLNEDDPLWALEGLAAGVHNAVDPTKWKASRLGMTKEANAMATEEIMKYWRDKDATSREGDVVMMDYS